MTKLTNQPTNIMWSTLAPVLRAGFLSIAIFKQCTNRLNVMFFSLTVSHGKVKMLILPFYLSITESTPKVIYAILSLANSNRYQNIVFTQT